MRVNQGDRHRGIGGKPPTKRRAAKLVSVSRNRQECTKKLRRSGVAKLLERICRLILEPSYEGSRRQAPHLRQATD